MNRNYHEPKLGDILKPLVGLGLFAIGFGALFYISNEINFNEKLPWETRPYFGRIESLVTQTPTDKTEGEEN